MKNVFIISDTHFSHQGICTFLKSDGTKLRPWDNFTDMDEAMISNWNAVVRPKDKVYHLGDVFMNRKGRFILDRLNGDKVLIKGNHDIFKLNDYIQYFRDIRAYHILDGMILSHVPIHSDHLGRFGKNVHGHLHEYKVKLPSGELDSRYLTMCVEHINYTPVELSDIQLHFRNL
jgi:calcineurin-like phosphoesterase family protein